MNVVNEQFIIEKPNDKGLCQRRGCERSETNEVMWDMLHGSARPGKAMFCDECGDVVAGDAFRSLRRWLHGEA